VGFHTPKKPKKPFLNAEGPRWRAYRLFQYLFQGVIPLGPFRLEKDKQETERSKEHHEDNRHIEDQLLDATPCFKDRSGATAAESAAQSRAAHLQQDEENDGYCQNNLRNLNSWYPLLKQNLILAFVFDKPPNQCLTTSKPL
jgi:hypothetical protein